MNDFVNAVYDICDEWRFKFVSDQWWVLKATCEHQEFKAISRGAMPDEAFQNLMNDIVAFHQK